MATWSCATPGTVTSRHRNGTPCAAAEFLPSAKYPARARTSWRPALGLRCPASGCRSRRRPRRAGRRGRARTGPGGPRSPRPGHPAGRRGTPPTVGHRVPPRVGRHCPGHRSRRHELQVAVDELRTGRMTEHGERRPVLPNRLRTWATIGSMLRRSTGSRGTDLRRRPPCRRGCSRRTPEVRVGELRDHDDHRPPRTSGSQGPGSRRRCARSRACTTTIVAVVRSPSPETP